jgi:Wiskott-Aldrich syndrome protein
MADAKEPKKETVRITLPPRPNEGGGGAAPAPKRDTVRINLPARPPTISAPAPLTPPSAGTARPPVAKPLVPPAPSKAVTPPPFIPPSAPKITSPAAARAIEPAPIPAAAAPKKETARISVLPDPPKPVPTVQMKKTQPLITMPEAKTGAAPINVATAVEPDEDVDLAPMSLCWAVLGASALILLIQIWNYFA